MAEVAVTVVLMPEGTEVDLKNLEAKIRERVKVHSVSREPIAFGLESLKIIAVIKDAEGGTDPLENELSKIPGVGNVQVTGVTRLL
jgi:translation elongation factor aEF-1 beta